MFHTYVRATSGNTVDFDRATFLMDRDLLGATLDALREIRDGWDTGMFTSKALSRIWVHNKIGDESERAKNHRTGARCAKSSVMTRIIHVLALRAARPRVAGSGPEGASRMVQGVASLFASRSLPPGGSMSAS